MNYEKLPKTISAEELLSTPLPPVKWSIPDLLPAGLALFAGPSKAGKSWLTLWLCLQVAQGKPMWGREIEPHTVLYLSAGGQLQPPAEAPSPACGQRRSPRTAGHADGMQQHRAGAGRTAHQLPLSAPGHRADRHRHFAKGSFQRPEQQHVCQRLQGNQRLESIGGQV